MEFQVLGPVIAYEDATEVDLGGPKQRLVLAMLLAAQGATVSTGAFIEGLWMDSAPATARKTLQGYVHHLRSKIGSTLATDKAGYSLHLSATQVDERRFSTATEEARPLVELDPSEASERLTDALALWRGNAYADLDGELVLGAEITRLTELRIVALGDRIEADLALGRHEMLIGELESLTVEYPLQERFRALHMLALYRSGRHGEALRAYARARDYFIEEMGIEPSDRLAALEDRILARDASLEVALEETGGSARAVRGYELREVIATDESGTLYRGYQRSVGREVAVRVTSAELANDPQFIARYQADTARVAKLNHPNIVYVQDTWREPGRVYQVMQWIEGERLDTCLASRRHGQSSALKVLEQVGDALSDAHRAGVVHGDLSPRAVLVAESGDAYLTDFVVGRPAGTESDDRIALAAIAHGLLFGAAPAVTDRGYEPPPSSEMTPQLATVFEAALAGDGYPGIDHFVRAVRQALGTDVVELADEPRRAPRSDARCPYKGLQAFQRADAADFYGREDLVERIYDRLIEQRLVAVVGPSGSGKSSVVKAGLAARLESGGHPVLVTEMYPGAYPFEELEGALRRISVRYELISDQLVSNERGLLRVLKSVLPDDETELVLVIDQFEELFAMVASESMRALFLDNLVAAVSDARSRLRVVVTMRADFFDRPLQYAEFGALVEAGLVPVTMPNEIGLTAAIERPAAAVGLEIEPGLVAEIIRDVSDQPGGLPLLQYALTELFHRRSADVLGLDAYRASGGVLGALAIRAEGLFNDLAPGGQRAMHQAFLRLVTVDEGADNVRRRVTRAELATLEVDGAALDEGLRRFGAHRLLTFDADPISRAPTVEVAHEALLSAWDRLRGWVDEQRDHLVLRRRLDAAIQEWEDSGEDSAYLLSGGRLAQFDAWAAATELALSSSERAYLQMSRERDEQLARRAASRRRRVMAALVAAAVIAASFGVYALGQRSEAAEEAYDAETARLGNQAGFVSEWNRQLSLLMAVETFRRDSGFEGLSALQRVLVDAGPFLGVLGAGNDYRDVHWLSSDRLLAATDTEVHLLKASSGELTTLPIELAAPSAETVIDGARPPVSGIRGSSPAGIAAVADAQGRLWLVDVTDGSVEEFPPGTGSRAVAISDDGALVAVGHPDGMVEIFDRRTGSLTAAALANPPRGEDDIELDANVRLDDGITYELGGINWLAFDPEGRRILTSGGVFLRAWNVDDLSDAGPEIIHAWGADDFNLFADEPRYFWFDESDQDVVVVAGDTYVVRWRTSTGERVSLGTVPIGPTDGPSDAISIRDSEAAGDGRILVLAGTGRVLRLDIDDLDSGASVRSATEGFVFDTQQNEVSALAIDDSRSRFAVASNDGIVTGAMDGSRLLARSVPIGLSVRPTLSRDGQTLAAGLVSDGIHDLATDPPSRVQFDVDVEIAQFAGSPATFQFTPAAHADVLLWTSTFMEISNAYDIGSGEYLGDFWGSYVPAWSDDGGRVARVARAGGTRVDDLGTGTRIFLSPASMRAADFDSDGSRVSVTFVDQPGLSPGLVVDLQSGAESPLPDLPGGTFGAAFTPDDEQIVLIGGAGAVWVLDAATLNRVGELQDADIVTETTAQPPVFSADGQWMFSAADGVARLWDLDSGRQLGKPFPTQAGGVPYGIGDGHLLRLVTPLDGNAMVWNLDMDTWVDVACRAAGRNMTRTEWNGFGPRDTDYRATCPEP